MGGRLREDALGALKAGAQPKVGWLGAREPWGERVAQMLKRGLKAGGGAVGWFK